MKKRPTDNLVFGKNPVFEIIRAGRRQVEEIFVTSAVEKSRQHENLWQAIRSHRVKVSVVKDVDLNRFAETPHHQGIVAQVSPYPYVSWPEILSHFQEKSLVLFLDSLQDPQNFGTLCRSALAFGVQAVVLPKDRAALVTPSVCKASAGAVEHLRVVKVTNLVTSMLELKEKGFWIYGAALSDGAVAFDKAEPAQKSVLVLGSEGSGLRTLVAKTCDVLIKIPMVSDFDSLNVAQAGTLCLYEFARKIKIF